MYHLIATHVVLLSAIHASSICIFFQTITLLYLSAAAAGSLETESLRKIPLLTLGY